MPGAAPAAPLLLDRGDGASAKVSPAIRRAVTEFVRWQRVREFGRLLREGAFDYPLTNDEIESEDR